MKQFKESRIEYLTSKFLEKGLSSQERTEFNLLLQNSESYHYFKKEYILWNLSSSDESEIERAWQKVLAQIETGNNRNENDEKGKIETGKVRNLAWIRTVAAIVVAFVLGMSACYFVFDMSGSSKKNPMEVRVKPSLVRVNRITAPLGSKSRIDLPDGTTVVLNAGSHIEYAMNYGASLREIKLEGEAYFIVAKNPDCPFVVHAKNTSIKALGTEFNVKAYADEDIVQTTLVEGMVSVNPNVKVKANTEEIILTPNQMLTIQGGSVLESNSKLANKQISEAPLAGSDKNMIPQNIYEEKISKETVNTLLYTSWKDPRWIIEGEVMESLASKLQRRFNVNVVIASPGLKKYKFSGILEDETLEQVLDIMKNIAPINYYIDRKTVVLTINPEQREAFEKSMNY